MKKSDELLAAGRKAKDMIGRTPGNIKAMKPLQKGVIADFEITEAMIRHFIQKTINSLKLFKSRIIICIPSGSTDVERRFALNAVQQAGVKKAYLIEEAMAAAMGVGLPVQKQIGNMIVDIGGVSSEMAVISLGSIVNSEVISDGGNKMDTKIIQYIKNKYNLAIGERTAEEIKKEISTVSLKETADSKEIRGRNLVEGLPKAIEIKAEEIKAALQQPVENIVSTVKRVLENTHPELASDIINQGIMLTGGGGLLTGIDTRIQKEVEIAVHTVSKPLKSVTLGTGLALEEIDTLEEILISSGEY